MFHSPGSVDQYVGQKPGLFVIESVRADVADAVLVGQVRQATTAAMTELVQQSAQGILEECVDVELAGKMLAFLIQAYLTVEQAVLRDQATLFNAGF